MRQFFRSRQTRKTYRKAMKIHPYYKSILWSLILAAVPAFAQPTFTTLYSFDGTAGSKPRSGLIQGTNGNFYGMAYQGGSNGLGAIYEMTPSGTVTDLVDFLGFSNGAEPSAPLIQGHDGKLYGEALSGTFGRGTGLSTRLRKPFHEHLYVRAAGGKFTVRPIAPRHGRKLLRCHARFRRGWISRHGLSVIGGRHYDHQSLFFLRQ